MIGVLTDHYMRSFSAHRTAWHFQGLKVCESTSRLIEVVPLTRIPSIHPPSTGLPALHLQGESLINPAVERLKER